MNTERARSLRAHSTPAERTVWNWLRDRRLLGIKFRRQHPVANYVLDFYCAEMQLCIEVDGGVHDNFPHAMRDVERSCELSKLGISVIRIRNEDVRRQPTACWDFIVGAVTRIVCERTGKSEREVMRQLYARTPFSPPRGEKVAR